LGVTFTDSSTGTITNRLWDFGDGSTSNTPAAQVLHAYAAGNFRVKLTATGPLGSSSRQRNNYISVTNAPAKLLVTPASQNFGQVAIGGSNALPFQVINLGSLSLTGSVTTTLPFSVASPGGPGFTLAGGQTSVVLVAFSPSSTLTYSTNVVFTSNGGNSTNTVTGSGLTPPQLIVTPSSLNFGITAVGSNVQGSFSATNLGSAPLSNCAASLSNGPFRIVSGTPFDLPGFGSTNVMVSFSPTNAGSFSNVLIFTSGNRGASTNALTGIGASAPLADFVASPTNGFAPLTVSFTDSSSGTITNRLWDFGDSSTTNTTATSFAHTYAAAATNVVKLTVTGPLGSSTRTSYITITSANQLVITSIRIVGSDVLVGFTSKAGQVYRLEYVDNLSPAAWQTVADNVSGTGDVVIAAHFGGAGRPFRFYRVRLLTNTEAEASVSPSLGKAPRQVTWVDTSAGYVADFLLDFGDGS